MKRMHASILAIVAGMMTVLPAPAWSQTSKEATIRVIGHATIETVPDHVTVQVGVSIE